MARWVAERPPVHVHLRGPTALDRGQPKENFTTKLPRTHLGTGLAPRLARTGTNTGTPQENVTRLEREIFRSRAN